MRNKEFVVQERITLWIDYCLIILLSIFCLKYVTFEGRSFAETSVQFGFLKFPVFIGEFLLGGCLLLSSFKWFLNQERIQRWHWIIFCFYGFVIIKALMGYQQWGALAFRDAALFYYSLFIFIAFFCFRLEVFRWWLILIFYIAIFSLAFEPSYNEFWLIPRLFLGLVLAYKFPNRKIGLLMVMSILIFTPYLYFIVTSRSVFLGGYIAISFFLLVVPLLVRKERRVLWWTINIFIICLLGVYSFYYSGSRATRGLLAFQRLENSYKEMQNEILKKKDTFVPRESTELAIFSPSDAIEFGYVERKETNSSLVYTVNLDKDPVNDTTKNSVSSIEKKVQKDLAGKNVSASVSNLPVKRVAPANSDDGMKIGNSIFRLLIWKDAVEQIKREGNILGISFGKPFRSYNLEMVRSAVSEWQRDGWIAMHNSYLNILYRAGLVGILFLGVVIWGYVYMVRTFVVHQSLAGLFACSSLLVPFVAAFFAVTLEVPYFAIPIWTLYGFLLRLAYDQNFKHKKVIPQADV